MSYKRLTVHKSIGGIGFRNLRDFNLALLEKQGWRLQCRPDSLVSRLFKTWYYHDSRFVEAKLGNSPSFIWRSIF